MPSYKDSDGRDVQLGSQINQGGEGTIHHIVGDQSRVAKIWRVPSRERAIKLIATINNTPAVARTRRDIRYCWPQDVLHDGRIIVGYIMPAVNTNEFRQSQEFFNEALRKDTEKKLGVAITEKTLVTAARELCAAVAEIHAAGHVIGDVNEKNILINSDGTIRIVDIDAIQIYDPESDDTHRCTVGRDEYTPPRLQGESFQQTDRTQDDDCFGLAVLIFKLTMGGRHPFTSRLSRDDDTAITGLGQKIKNEYFPYNQDDTVPDQYKVAVDEYKQAWDNSRDQIRTLFLQTFDPFETRNRPRPTATEWTDELAREIELIEHGRRKPAKPTSTSSPQIRGDTAENQAEVQRALNQMQKDLKRLVIAYADRLQKQHVWSADQLPKDTVPSVRDINGIADIRACSDTLALLHCLISVTKKLDRAWARDNSLLEGLVAEVKNYRNAEHELDLFDDQYTNRALQAIKKLHDGIKDAPKSLPDRAIWKGASTSQQQQQTSTYRTATSANKTGQPPRNQRQSNAPGNQRQPNQKQPPNRLSNLGTGQRNKSQQRPRTQTVPTYRATTVRERLLAQCFLLSTVFSVGTITLIATPRVHLEDLSIVLVGVVTMIGSGFWLWKTSEDPAEQLGKELKKAGTLAAKAVKGAFQMTGRIQNQKTKWTVRVGPIVVLVVTLVAIATYLSTPNAAAVPPAAEPKEPTNQASKATPPTGSPNSAIPKSAAPTPQRSLAFHHNGPPVQNRFLDLPYDASKTLNNRQAPANQRNCAGGSKPLTRWSRTHEIQDQGALIADARGETTRVVELHFARIHPGRGYLQDNCPEEHILAQATLVTVHGNPPDLTEYVALWQDHAGNEIARDDARDGISIELPVSLNPEALYEGPARLLIYDQYILGTQPTLTPETEAAPYQKEFSLHIDPTTWPVDAQRNQIKGMYYWSEVVKHSPDPAPRHIYDVQGNEWHLDTIGVVEKHHTRLGANPTADWAEYTVTFSNHSRAYADFTGYLIQISTPDGTSVATNHWQRPEGLELIGSTTFTVRIPTELQGALQLKALDPYEQSPVEK